MHNHFDILERIGKGGYGEVYKCIFKTTRKLYAVKITKIEQRLTAWCINEASILSTFKHPYLLHSKATYFHNKALHFITPLANCDMHAYIKEKPCMVDTNRPLLIEWMFQLSQSVDMLHNYNIIHGDIKPANVLVYDKVVKLADFTLSVQKPDINTTYKSTAYTINYRAPEVLMAMISKRDGTVRRNMTWSTSADIWALGCTFFMMTYKYQAFVSQVRDNVENIHILYKSLMYIASIVCDPEDIYSFQTGLQFKFEPSTPWPDDKTGDTEINTLLLPMLRVSPKKRIDISQVLKHHIFSGMTFAEFDVTFPISLDTDLPVLYGDIPKGVSRVVHQLWAQCKYMDLKDKLETIVVVALKLTGHSSHERVTIFNATHSLSSELAVLQYLGFKVLMAHTK